MRAASGFDTQNAVLRERSPARKKFGILLGEDVVGDHRQTYPIAQTEAKRFDQRGLSRPYRSSDTDDRNMTRPRRSNTPIATKMFIGSMHRYKRIDGVCF
jgi:hypothetical protein